MPSASISVKREPPFFFLYRKKIPYFPSESLGSDSHRHKLGDMAFLASHWMVARTLLSLSMGHMLCLQAEVDSAIQIANSKRRTLYYYFLLLQNTIQPT